MSTTEMVRITTVNIAIYRNLAASIRGLFSSTEDSERIRMAIENLCDNLECLQSELRGKEEELKRRDKCSFIGAMRDCPTHGESAELPRLRDAVEKIGSVLRAHCIGESKDGMMKCFVCDNEWEKGEEEDHVQNPVCFASRFFLASLTSPTKGWLVYKIIADPEFLKPLKGKNLTCWCPLDQPCHADVLLKLAASSPEGKKE